MEWFLYYALATGIFWAAHMMIISDSDIGRTLAGFLLGWFVTPISIMAAILMRCGVKKNDHQ